MLTERVYTVITVNHVINVITHAKHITFRALHLRSCKCAIHWTRSWDCHSMNEKASTVKHLEGRTIWQNNDTIIQEEEPCGNDQGLTSELLAISGPGVCFKCLCGCRKVLMELNEHKRFRLYKKRKRFVNKETAINKQGNGSNKQGNGSK